MAHTSTAAAAGTPGAAIAAGTPGKANVVAAAETACGWYGKAQPR
jgi:hypothetical protein